MSQKITPNLWCENNAREVAEFYVSIFPNSKITGGSTYPLTKEEGLGDFQLEFAGKDLTIDLNINEFNFTLINGGATFSPNSSISFLVNFDPSLDPHARENLDELWDMLIKEGEEIMPLSDYDFSERYGWVKDQYGCTWQLILTDPTGELRPFIVPSLTFSGPVQNKAQEAVDFYTSVFAHSRKGNSYMYERQIGPASPEALMYADFTIEDEWFAACDSATEQGDVFTEGISLSIACKDQTEIDTFWKHLSAVPDAEQCGWCKDKYGVSWQIVPENIDELMKKPGAYKTLMKQHKIIISEY